jgi:hypothetical protein
MDDLVTWLRAQLDDDERVAKGASMLSRPPWTPRITCDQDGYVSGRITDDRGYAVVHVEDQTPASAEAEHIARWDPARVLAEVDAKRRILELHAPVNDYDPNGPVCSTCGEAGNPGDETAVVRWPCSTVRLVALPYADRPGYREEWRP